MLQRFLLILLVLFVVMAVWLKAIRASQFAPHRITQSINGHVFSDFWTTNPAYVSYQVKQAIGSNGLYYYREVRTNYYWSVWPIFRK